MSGVRVLVGTRKGAFVLTSDAKRAAWDVSGPPLRGLGDLSREGGPGTHQWYDGTPHPWEFARVWHLEPSLTDPDTVYAGVEDAALFRTTDGGWNWHELPGLRSEQIPNPTAEVGPCVHRLAMHPSRPQVLFMQKHWDVMRSDDAGDSWQELSGNLPTDFGFAIDVHAHEPETIYVVGERLRAVSSTTSVCGTGGKTHVVDGPYAEAKEQLGGFHGTDVPDLDTARAWAARCPSARRGRVEVRPVWPL